MATRSEFRKYNGVNTKGETPLHLAAKNENHDGKNDIENLLTKGVDVNARNKWGQTPLQYAAIAGCLRNIEILTKYSGIDVNSKDINGYNALQSLIAANDGESNNSDDNLPVMSICLPGDDDDDADIFKIPLCLYGRMKKTFSIDLRKSLQALINAGIDVNNQTTFGDGILHLIATREENTPLLKFFISNFPDTNLNLINIKNENFLHVYVTHELLEDIFELLECIAKYDQSSLRALLSSRDVFGKTPWNLMIGGSGYTTSAENLKTILSYGVSPKVNDTLGNTVLHQICGVSHGYVYGDVLEYLLEIGADINAQNMYGESVLSLTLSEHIFNIFCEFNADCKIYDRWGRSALVSIMKYRPMPDLFRAFLVKGTVNLNTSDMYGSTPLHFAAYHNYEEQIEILLLFGADMNARDNLQERPLDTAKRHNSFRCIALLKAADRTAVEHTSFRKSMHRDKTFEEILYGLPETIISSCIISPQDIQTLLELPLNLKDFMNYLLESYYTRSPKYSPEVESVTLDVNNLVTSLCTQIQKYDSRFEMSVFPSGSMAEGTKIGRPDEFDFILCLDKLNDITDIVMTDNLLKSGFASLKFKTTQVFDEYLPFTDADGYFLPILFLRLFYDYLKRALNESHQWKEGNFYYNVENSMVKLFTKPVFTFDVYWLGSVYKQLRISIDLVPAVYKRGWWPINTDIDKIPLVSPDIKAAGCFLTLQTKAHQIPLHDKDCISRTCYTKDPEEEQAKKRLLRISAAPAEICLMKSLPDDFRQAYILAKVLKNVCPDINVETKQYKLEEEDSEYEKPRRTRPSTLIKSYMLKNSVFYVLDELKMKNQLEDGLEVSEITIKMYHFLLRFVDGGYMHMRPYFLSNDVNVFETSSELSSNKTFIFHLQREFSIKLMLGILNAKFPKECLAA
ncbi:uncharacterized protein LOC127718189 [Mytilus californianus]|uniref:uncharacterized protein LOC127718189 n=1 Tax=Mytilus californianus TaxID=6549 RepID=UPI002245BDC8|nr:uncharacterized protein LOC127718189 [Mytilus californianus]XP_052080117.1 uncharacterized protein LOC127718189 [Mytilus californianus]XP_052080118.1 uncharacterized protein LOC127718189 [Mytilus californianus]